MMLGYLDLLDVNGNTVRFAGSGAPNRVVTNVQGLPGLGFAGARDASYDRPSYHGSVTRSRWMKAAIVTIEGYVKGTSAELVQTELDVLSIPLLDCIDTPALLRWQRGTTGIELQASARLTGDEISVSVDAGGKMLRYQAHLRLDDPRGYLQTLTTATGGHLATGGGATMPRTIPVTFDAATGGTVAVNNTGTRPTPPVFKVYGYATSAQIVLVGAGVRIALTGTIAPGDFVQVDVAARTLKLNGTSPAQYLLDTANTTWFELPRGASTIQMLAGANDSVARCDALYRPAYA
jgi:hypothetical protein